MKNAIIVRFWSGAEPHISIEIIKNITADIESMHEHHVYEEKRQNYKGIIWFSENLDGEQPVSEKFNSRCNYQHTYVSFGPSRKAPKLGRLLSNTESKFRGYLEDMDSTLEAGGCKPDGVVTLSVDFKTVNKMEEQFIKLYEASEKGQLKYNMTSSNYLQKNKDDSNQENCVSIAEKILKAGEIVLPQKSIIGKAASGVYSWIGSKMPMFTFPPCLGYFGWGIYSNVTALLTLNGYTTSILSAAGLSAESAALMNGIVSAAKYDAIVKLGGGLLLNAAGFSILTTLLVLTSIGASIKSSIKTPEDFFKLAEEVNKEQNTNHNIGMQSTNIRPSM